MIVIENISHCHGNKRRCAYNVITVLPRNTFAVDSKFRQAKMAKYVSDVLQKCQFFNGKFLTAPTLSV